MAQATSWPSDMITQERLKEVLNYNKETGVFTWELPTALHKFKGDIAGSLTNKGYIIISINCKRYMAHRLAWLYVNGKWPEKWIDHINHNRVDNRWSNIREATDSINQKNATKMSNNKSGYTGVSWDKYRNKWRAYVYVGGKQKLLGRFKDKEQAIATRAAANLKYNFHENHGL